MCDLNNEKLITKNSNFLDFCNSIPKNSTDEAIAKVVYSYFNKIDELTVDKIANESATSPSSVIRFFSKAGYSSVTEFKIEYSIYLNMFNDERKKIMNEIYPYSNLASFTSKYYDYVTLNLSNTSNCINLNTTSVMWENILKKNKIFIISDKHSLTELGVIQIALLSYGIQTFLIPFHEAHSIKFENDDALIVASIDSKYNSKITHFLFNSAKIANCYSVLITQDDYPDIDPDIKYFYGVQNYSIIGYYSLSFLANLFVFTIDYLKSLEY